MSLPTSVSGTVTTYQWYKDGALLSAQTSATLSLNSVQIADQGNYQLVVAGACNSLTSTAFSLTVNAPPTFILTASPSATLTCAQSTVTLTATPNMGIYVFSAGASQIGGTTGNSATVSAAGIYSVTLTGTGGCSATTSSTITSAIAAITLTSPAISTATVGSPFSQTFSASGGNAPYSVQSDHGRTASRSEFSGYRRFIRHAHAEW